MEFNCFRCNEIFNSSKDVIVHLKRVHFMLDNTEPIKCVVKNCEKSYNTFKGLSHHLKTFGHQQHDDVCYLLYHDF